VILVELIAPHAWQKMTSSDGVRSQVTLFRRPALVRA
jgi:hypothetical protein